MELFHLLTYCLRLLFRLPPLLSFLIIAFFGVYSLYINFLAIRFTILWYGKLLRKRNAAHRIKLLGTLPISQDHQASQKVIGFFHPYCNAGGGGERVLWTAVAFHQRQHPDHVCAVYTGDIGITKHQMITKVEERFDIRLAPESFILVPLTTRYLVEAHTWPRFTLIGQSLGSIVVGFEALSRLIPDIYIDTMGYAFTFPLFVYLTGVPVGAYVHYPTISTDMLERVSNRSAAHNNDSRISNSFILSYAKLLYYMLFAELYSACLRQADYVMVNSSWTKNHIDRLLKPWLHRDDDRDDTPAVSQTPAVPSMGIRQRPRASATSIEPVDRKTSHQHAQSMIVYPPCDVKSFVDFPLHPRTPTILSISQFRPEKDQAKQIEAFARFIKSHPSPAADIRLVLAGSCRGEADEQRVEDLRARSRQLGVADRVEFKVNVDWKELTALLSCSMVGISTMVDEHFGISVVEFMAAGLVPLVHASGGPLKDIVVQYQEEETGFFGTDVESYAEQLTLIFGTDESRLTALRARARELSREKFRVAVFEREWAMAIENLEAIEAGQKRRMRQGWDTAWWPTSGSFSGQNVK